MREIKFRGRNLNGEIFHGDLYHFLSDPDCFGIVDEKGIIRMVEPDSVVQLIGRDADGKEIYEGDYVELVVDGKQYVYRAHFEGFATADNGDRYLCPKQLSKTRLVS